MDSRSTHLPALDGLRAVAVFTVIVYHFGIAAVPGDLGGSAFFVLSGFLITWLLLLLLRGGAARAARVLTGVIVAVLVWRSVLYAGFHVGSAYVYNAFDTRFDNLAVGCLLALTTGTPRAQAIATRLSASPLAPLLTLVLLVVSRAAIGNTYHYTGGFTVDAVLVAAV